MPDTHSSPLANRLARRAKARNTSPLFYGWIMLAVTTLTTMATSPGQSFVVGAFSEAIRADLDISLQQFAGAYMIATFLASLPLTLVGRLGDRFGTRVMMGSVATLLGLACAFIGLSTHLISTMDASETLVMYASLAVLTCAFFLLRFLGQGALGLVSSHTLAMWFERRLGFAEAIRHLGMPLGLAVLPVAIVTAIEVIGWRSTYALLGLLVWLIVLPLVFLVHVNTPEDLGQNIDADPTPRPHSKEDHTNIELDAPSIGDAGDTHDHTARSPKPRATDTALHQFTLKQAMRTPAYWIVTASMVLSAAVGTAFVFHAQPMMADLALAPERTAAGVLATLGLVSLITSLPFGALVDRIMPRHLLAITGLLLAAACTLYALATTNADTTILGFKSPQILAHCAYFMLALSQGLLFLLASPIFARYYGRTHHGAIRGSLTTFMVIGTSAGPFVFAAARDITSNFAPIYLTSGIVAILFAILATRLHQPKPPSQS